MYVYSTIRNQLPTSFPRLLLPTERVARSALANGPAEILKYLKLVAKVVSLFSLLQLLAQSQFMSLIFPFRFWKLFLMRHLQFYQLR